MALTKTPIELSSTPSIVDGGNATAITIDSSENVMVGTTDAAVGVGNTNVGHSIGATGYAAHSRSGNTSLFLNRTTSDGEIARFSKDGTTVGSIGTEGGDLTIGNADTGLQFVNTSQIIRPQNLTTNAAVDAQVSLDQSAYRFKDLYLSGGAFLGGTAAGNKLDDYEEGAFTTVSAGLNSSGYTPTMRYTKIGCLVNITARIIWTGSNNSSNGLTFTLPFDARDTADTATGTVFYTGTVINSGSAIAAYVAGGNVFFYNTAGGTSFESIRLNEVNGSYDWIFSFTYHTDE